MREWRMVGRRRGDGQKQEGSFRKVERMRRGGRDVGVTMRLKGGKVLIRCMDGGWQWTYRVRTRSNGESIKPVATAAAAATKRDAQG